MSISLQSIDEIQARIVQETPMRILEQHGDRIADLISRQERLGGQHALEQFIAGYIADELSARKAGERGPVCGCSLPTCPLKRGVLPARVRIRGSGMLRPIDTRRRAAEWILDHPGDGAVLQEALDERDEEMGHLYGEWMQLYERIHHEQWSERMGKPKTDTEAEPAEEEQATAQVES